MGHPAHSDSTTLGDRAAEKVASVFGSWRFLGWMTVFIVVWTSFNLVAFTHHWDPYPFILLNLVFSTQASYAAPIILLAQNRQSAIDRLRADLDHEHLTENTRQTSEIHAAIVGNQPRG